MWMMFILAKDERKFLETDLDVLKRSHFRLNLKKMQQSKERRVRTSAATTEADLIDYGTWIFLFMGFTFREQISAKQKLSLYPFPTKKAKRSLPSLQNPVFGWRNDHDRSVRIFIF